MHITASVYINDAESGLIQDYDDWLERLAPLGPGLSDCYVGRHSNYELDDAFDYTCDSNLR